MRERGARWRVLRVLSLPLTFTKNETAVDPRGVRAVVFSGTGWDLGYPRGPPPHPGSVRAQRLWLHRATLGGDLRQSPNRPIARRIRRRRERPGRRRVRRFRLRRSAECGGRAPSAVCRAGSRRCTMPRAVAKPTPSPSCSCAAPTGPSRPSTGTAALRRTAEPKPHQPRACRDTPKQYAEQYGNLAAYEAGEIQVHSAPHSAPHPSPGSSGRRMYRRRSPSALADPAGREATADAALAL
jgi:hypothetical protein